MSVERTHSDNLREKVRFQQKKHTMVDITFQDNGDIEDVDIHFLPMQIKHTGTANVQQFFKVTEDEENLVDGMNVYCFWVSKEIDWISLQTRKRLKQHFAGGYFVAWHVQYQGITALSFFEKMNQKPTLQKKNKQSSGE